MVSRSNGDQAMVSKSNGDQAMVSKSNGGQEDGEQEQWWAGRW
jgi:hypothetical protein